MKVKDSLDGWSVVLLTDGYEMFAVNGGDPQKGCYMRPFYPTKKLATAFLRELGKHGCRGRVARVVLTMVEL